MSVVFRKYWPPPPHRPASVYPPPLVRGEDTLAGWKGDGGSIFWKTLYIALYFAHHPSDVEAEPAVRTQNALLKEQLQYLALFCDVLALVSPSPLRAKRVEESCVHCTVACCAFSSTEETRVEEKQKEFLCSLSRRVHHDLARDGYIESTCCCVQARFRHWNTNTFSLLIVFSALFIKVFKALNLFLYKLLQKSICIAMAFGCSPYHSSLQLSIFAQTLGMAGPFNLPSQCKTCSPTALIWARWQSGQYSSL